MFIWITETNRIYDVNVYYYFADGNVECDTCLSGEFDAEYTRFDNPAVSDLAILAGARCEMNLATFAAFRNRLCEAVDKYNVHDPRSGLIPEWDFSDEECEELVFENCPYAMASFEPLL